MQPDEGVPLNTVTTATLPIPHPGHTLSCTASTACPVTVVGVDENEAVRMMLLHTGLHRIHAKEN